MFFLERKKIYVIFFKKSGNTPSFRTFIYLYLGACIVSDLLCGLSTDF